MKTLHFRLQEYSLLATTFIICHQPVKGEIIYTDIDPDIILDNDEESALIDMDGNGVFEFIFSKLMDSFPYYSIELEFSALIAGVYGSAHNEIAAEYTLRGSAASTTYFIYLPSCFTTGDVIGNGLSFYEDDFLKLAVSYWTIAGDFFKNDGNWWPNKEDKYLGVHFLDDANEYHYGWIRMSVIDSAEQLIIKDYAYEGNIESTIIAGKTFSDAIYYDEDSPEISILYFGNQLHIEFIQTESEKLHSKLNIYNMNGQLCLSKSLNVLNEHIELHLPSGIYLACVEIKENIITKQFIIP